MLCSLAPHVGVRSHPPTTPLCSLTATSFYLASQYLLSAQTRARFWIGVALAVYIGVANGSMMVPFEYAPKDAHGAEYVISFGIGAVSVNAVVFAAFSAYQVARGLPALSLQFRVAAGPAFLTGKQRACL